jgi:hypothetical protein
VIVIGQLRQRRFEANGQRDRDLREGSGTEIVVGDRRGRAAGLRARARACSTVEVPFAAGTPRPGRGVLLGDTFGSMTERATSAGDASGPKTRYHLLTTDGGMVANQPGKAAGEAAIGVVLKAPLEEVSEPIGPAKDHHVAEYRALIRGLEVARSRDWTLTRVPRFRTAGQPAERQVESQGGAPQALA